MSSPNNDEYQKAWSFTPVKDKVKFFDILIWIIFLLFILIFLKG